MLKVLLFIMFILCFAIGCIEKTDNINVTYEDSILTDCLPEGEYSYSHGDGLCSDSYMSCKGCNCTLRIEKWCENEQEEMEKYGKRLK